MEDSIDLEQAGQVQNIDVGGTPANILEKGKIGFLEGRGIRPEQLVVVVDPFDLSRIERSLVISDVGSVKRIKFSVEIPGGNEKSSSEHVRAPERDRVLLDFQTNRGKILEALYGKYKLFKPEQKRIVAARYDALQVRMGEIAGSSQNLREFMNSLVMLLSPTEVRLIPLERVLSENQTAVYDVLKQRDIEARVFCPSCGKITPYTFNQATLNEQVCCTTADEIIRQGRYVPEEGMLPTILYLSGINPCVGKDSQYGNKAMDILKSLGRFERPFIMHSGRPDKTMFEAFMLRAE